MTVSFCISLHDLSVKERFGYSSILTIPYYTFPATSIPYNACHKSIRPNERTFKLVQHFPSHTISTKLSSTTLHFHHVQMEVSPLQSKRIKTRQERINYQMSASNFSQVHKSLLFFFLFFLKQLPERERRPLLKQDLSEKQIYGGGVDCRTNGQLGVGGWSLILHVFISLQS